MSVKCDICGKTAQAGNAVSHSKRHTKRRWLPNLKRTTMLVEGKRKHINICTRCLRTQHKVAV